MIGMRTVDGLPQYAGNGHPDRRNGIRRLQQQAVRADRLDLIEVGLHARQIAGMTREMLDHRPRRQALGGQVARRRPGLDARFEVGSLVLDRNELLVAHQALHVLDIRSSRLQR